MSFKLRIWLFLTVCLCGCAASGPKFHLESPPIQSESLVYIYRVEATDLAIRTAILELSNGVSFELQGGGYAALKLKPGVYTVKQSWKPWPGDYTAIGKPIIASLDLRSGETSFLQFSIVTQQNFMSREISWGLDLVSPSVGQSKIMNYKQQINITKK